MHRRFNISTLIKKDSKLPKFDKLKADFRSEVRFNLNVRRRGSIIPLSSKLKLNLF